MAGVGVPWDRSVVANLENGRRSGVSVQEWLALAYVLSVQPVHLLVPIDATEDTPYQLVPKGRPSNALPVRAWIRGQTIIGAVDPRRYFSEVPEVEWQEPANWPWTADRYRDQGQPVQDHSVMWTAAQHHAEADRQRSGEDDDRSR
jgi:hypothetical protein